jgi:hypothetical protein
MRVIDLSPTVKHSRITALSYGMSRSGKTRFASSWPRPVFFSDATESGWETIRNMDKNILFEKDRLPIVWAIEGTGDMMKAVRDATPLIHSGQIRTIVIDSLTFYSDLFFNAIDGANGGRADGRQLYQKLGQHLKKLREDIHLLNCNVVWLALEKPPGEDNLVGGPMLSGQNAAKFAAGCDYLLYHRSYQTGNGPLQWEVRTKKYGAYQAGGRDEGLLPDPLGYVIDGDDNKEIFVADCTYRTMAEALGIAHADSLTVPVIASAPATPVIPVGTTAPVITAGTGQPVIATATTPTANSQNGQNKAPQRPNGPAPTTTAQPGRR